MPLKDPEARKAYERERKNKKRVVKIMQLPEPERTRTVETNAARRAYEMRWTSDKVRMRDL